MNTSHPILLSDPHAALLPFDFVADQLRRRHAEGFRRWPGVARENSEGSADNCIMTGLIGRKLLEVIMRRLSSARLLLI
ncbi:MAG TPA: hypothetical protein VI260_15260, partial [Blastocatellia bacterium]